MVEEYQAYDIAGVCVCIFVVSVCGLWVRIARYIYNPPSPPHCSVTTNERHRLAEVCVERIPGRFVVAKLVVISCKL